MERKMVRNRLSVNEKTAVKSVKEKTGGNDIKVTKIGWKTVGKAVFGDNFKSSMNGMNIWTMGDSLGFRPNLLRFYSSRSIGAKPFGKYWKMWSREVALFSPIMGFNQFVWNAWTGAVMRAKEVRTENADATSMMSVKLDSIEVFSIGC